MEIITSENILLIGSLLLIVGVVIGKMSYRFGLPLLLVFLLVGIAFGVDGVGIQFEDMHTAQFIGMIALCIILFSGGMGTKISAVRPVLMPGLVLSTVGVLLTAVVTGLFIWWLSGMSWTNIHFSLIASLLLAATMSSTDSASVFGILGSHKVRLSNNLRPMLELESGSNDPMAYMLTILLIEAMTNIGDITPGEIVLQLILQFGVGIAGGYITGRFAVWLVNAYLRLGGRKADSGGDSQQTSAMLSILILGMVFLTFALTTDLAGNGYLAVYILGIVLGNAKLPCRRGILKFMDGMTWLAQIVVFLMLGLLVNPHEMLDVAAVSLLIGIFMIILGRPLSVMLCLLPFRRLPLRAKSFVSWVGLRGAVPIIFATYPVVAGVDGASQIFNIVFFVTLVSLLVQGTTVLTAARKLKLTEGTQEDDDFGVELSDNLPTSLQTITLGDEDIEHSPTLKDMKLPEGTLVMMIRRRGRYIVPNGTRRLQSGDTLLIIREEDA